MAIQLDSGSGKGKRPVPVMNVTPLVDVALVVLIIFMLVVPMSQQGFWLHLPNETKTPPVKPEENEDPQEPLVMTIDSRDVIRVNKAVLKLSDFPTRLPRMLAAQPVPVVFFDAADNVPYGRSVEVMDAAKAAGAKAIAVLTEKVAH